MREDRLKCGIVTFHRAMNYGAVLQMYALYSTLETKGVQAEIIDIRGDRLDRHYAAPFPNFFCCLRKVEGIIFKKLLFAAVDFARAVIHYPMRKKMRACFDEFLHDKVHMSQSCASHEELKKIEGQYDFFICGSDQVWNMNIIDFNADYFLEFAPDHKKNAYAVSFGKDELPEVQKTEYRRLVSVYERISVREEGAIKLVQELGVEDCTRVLDPTFLLTPSQWRIVAEPCPNKPENYILVYMLYDLDNSHIMEQAKRVSDSKGLPIVYIGSNRKFRVENTVKYSCLKPMQWVDMFLDAACVVTNSFHGTAFAINFNKDFYVSLLKPAERPANNRLVSVLNLFELQDRLLENLNSLPMHEEKIDWDKVNQILLAERRHSENYINGILARYK